MGDSVFPVVLVIILGILVIFFIYYLGNEYYLNKASEMKLPICPECRKPATGQIALAGHRMKKHGISPGPQLGTLLRDNLREMGVDAHLASTGLEDIRVDPNDTTMALVKIRQGPIKWIHVLWHGSSYFSDQEIGNYAETELLAAESRSLGK